MRIGQGFKHLDDDVNFLPMGDIPHLRGGAEIGAFDILHDKIGHICGANATIDDMDDIGVVEAGDDEGFAFKSMPGLLVRFEVVDQQFDGNWALQGILYASIDMCHATFANL